MSKENQEPLLPKSPPSPVQEIKWLESGTSNTKIVIIHHWSEYDQGSHKIHEIEIQNSHRVLDIIILSAQQFYPGTTDPSMFSLRIANASGKPKTSMPVLDVGQGIFDTGIVRFALCSKVLDSKRSELFENFEAASPTETVENPKIVGAPINHLEQHEKKPSTRKRICCCFYSE